MMVTRKNIVWKLERVYCLCYCKTFSTESIKKLLPKSAVYYLYCSKLNNGIAQRKITNAEKQFYP